MSDDELDELESFELTKAYTFGNREIQITLRKGKLLSMKRKNVLLLGCENSGKSTIMKQIRRLFGDGYTDKEKMKHTSLIHKFIINQMQKLMEYVVVTRLDNKGIDTEFTSK